MLNLIHLQSFLVVAEERSIIKASKKLFVNPSSLQQQMNLFEAELGFKVLERSRKGCTLTDAGRVVAERGTALFADIDAMMQQAAEVADRQEQTVAIAMIAPYNALPLLNAFREKHPKVQFKHEPFAFSGIDEMTSALLEGRLDVAEFGFASPKDNLPVSFQEYARGRMCVACSASHPLAKRDEVDLADLEGQKVFACKNGSDINRLISSYLDEHGLDVDFRKTVYSMERVMDICEQGDFFMLANDQTTLFQHLHIMPFTPEFHYRHSFAYADHCRPIVQDFIAFVRENTSIS